MLATWGCTTFSKPTLDLQFVGATSLDNRITFSRGSQATLFDSTGTLVYANNNLLTYSEDFGNAAWTKTRASVSTNATTAPNGTLTAGKLIEDLTASNTHLAFSGGISVIASTVYTYTIYAKAAERTWFNMQIGTGAEAYGATVPFCYFDLANGAIGSSGSVTGTITPVGNGWYRCSAVAIATTSATTTNMRIKLATGNSVDSYTGDGTSGIFIWGAMLNIGSTAGPYVQTVASAYYAPRFDYNPSTLAAQGLLIEEQRTNSIRNNTMQGAVAGTPGTAPTNWSTFTALTGLTREIVGTGTESGITYIDVRVSGTPSAAGLFLINFESNTQNVASNGQSWSGSTYCKLQAGSLTGISSLVLRTSALDAALVEVSTTSQTFTPTTAALSTQRISANHTNTSASTAYEIVYLRVFLSGVAIDITLRIGLPQLELGAFATSVIPTTTTALTRNADVASMTGTNFSSWYNAAQGTMLGEYNVPFALTSGSNPRVASFLGAGGANVDDLPFFINQVSGKAASFNAFTASVNAGRIDASASFSANTITKAICAYGTNDRAVTTGGTSPTTSATVYTIPTVNKLDIGSSSSINFLNGTIRRIAYYPVRLANTTLQALTA
jgi:hypothetical protein